MSVVVRRPRPRRPQGLPSSALAIVLAVVLAVVPARFFGGEVVRDDVGARRRSGRLAAIAAAPAPSSCTYRPPRKHEAAAAMSSTAMAMQNTIIRP